MHDRSGLAVLAGLALLVGGCEVREIAPPAAPVREMPKVEEGRTRPVTPGLTRVILDADGAKASVVDVVDISSSLAMGTTAGGRSVLVSGYSETVKPVCLAPCVADLTPGLHVLRFASTSDDRSSVASVQIEDRPKVVRHAMGRASDDHPVINGLAFTLLGLGAAAAVTGGGLYAASVATRDADPAFRDDTTLGDVGLGVGLGGLAAVAVAVPVMLLTQPTRQSGSTTEWNTP